MFCKFSIWGKMNISNGQECKCHMPHNGLKQCTACTSVKHALTPAPIRLFMHVLTTEQAVAMTS